MTPRLIAISGSAKGTTLALNAEEISLGREASNLIHLNEQSVSRRHCLIRREPFRKPNQGPRDQPNQAQTQASRQSPAQAPTPAPGDAPEQASQENSESNQEVAGAAPWKFTIVDLESYNGTFVNGVPVREQELKHGDQIAVGDVVLLFLLDETEADAALPAHLGEGNLITRSTVRLKREDALYLRPDKVAAEIAPSNRVARDLNMLLAISNSIGTRRNPVDLQKSLLTAISEVIPAERGAIVLDDGQDVPGICGWNRISGFNSSTKPSRTITQQVMREGIALLSNDLFDQKVSDGRASLIEANVCSVLCVPLIVFDCTIGAIYLDTSNTATRFDENDLQLLTAIAGIAAVALENARRVESLEHENQRLNDEIKIEHKLVGESRALRDVLQFIAKVAPADSTVLIRGESGTGKELAARAIHLNSGRANQPFVAINCATLTETLIETELFGHEKGAFTGAIALKRGKLEIADGGTIFLDELAELTPLIQAKLLRVIQEREFERLGGIRPIKVDVRIITATNQNLEDAIKEKKFREDLYYRLNVVSVVLPALKDRREDIPLLANYFVSIFSKKCKRRVRGISQEARALLQAYDWPGNVRELENTIERAVVLGNDESITPDDLPERLLDAPDGVTSSGGFYQAVTNAKKQLIMNAITQAAGNYTHAARSLGIHPNNLHRLIRTLNLKSEIKTP